MAGRKLSRLRRFRLPRTLPPSFKGVAARFSYQLQATVQFALPKKLPSIPSIPLSSSAAVLADSHEPGRNPFVTASAAASNDGVPSRLHMHKWFISAGTERSREPCHQACLSLCAVDATELVVPCIFHERPASEIQALHIFAEFRMCEMLQSCCRGSLLMWHSAHGCRWRQLEQEGVQWQPGPVSIAAAATQRQPGGP